jgi:hypothetical protein
MQFLRESMGAEDDLNIGESSLQRLAVKLAYDMDSALAASGDGAGPTPIVSRQASRESQSS